MADIKQRSSTTIPFQDLTTQPTIEYDSQGEDSSGERYRFHFVSKNDTPGVQNYYLESRWGIDIYYVSNQNDGLSANWQCWEDNSTAVWTFVISEVLGPAGHMQIQGR